MPQESTQALHVESINAPYLVLNDTAAGRKTLTKISSLLATCGSFRFFVAFVNQEGVISLIDQLIALEKRGVRGKVLVSQYLNFTSPQALRTLLKFSNLDLRINTADSMHTKGYFFYGESGAQFLIGSSNWTAAALASNLELNVLVSAGAESPLYEEVSQTFDRYFALATQVDEEFIRQYEKEVVAPETSQVIDAPHLALVEPPARPSFQTTLQPNAMQAEALSRLSALRAAGENKALVVSATGTGKTYLAAFDALSVGARRLLFVVHRETIAKSALEDFRRIFGVTRTYGVLGGGLSEVEADFVFCTVQTLSKEKNLKRFEPDQFDYVIVDESHRAGANSYKFFLDYFSPHFLLGMTATPERTDGEDIFKFFDFNLAYEIRLQRALEEKMLCPFHYFGVSDLTIDGAPVDDLTEFRNLVTSERVEHIISAVDLYGCDDGVVRGLVFCSRVEECEVLALRFNERGKRSIALSGRDSNEDREAAIVRLEADPRDPAKLDYIFSVDVFNEGIDIPLVNQIVMLRPTQSAIIFVQQLGRGLRKLSHREKYLTVIDFIGNYSQNFLIPVALYGDQTLDKDELRRLLVGGNDLLPGQSTVSFDEVSRQRIFDSVNQSNLNTYKELKADYRAMRARVGRIPKMLDFVEHGGRDPYSFARHKKSFYEFSKSVEDEGLVPPLDVRLEKVLESFSKYVLNGKYFEEIEIVDRLLQGMPSGFTDLAAASPWSSSEAAGRARFKAAVVNLNLEFRREQVKRAGQTKLVTIGENLSMQLFQIENDRVVFHQDLLDIWTDEFADQLADLSATAGKIFRQNLDLELYSEGLIRYRKYDRGDVFRALLWDENPVAQNVGGYLISPDKSNCPIFVTYDKRDEIASTIKYEDAFIDPQTLVWFSKSKRTLDSPEIQYLRNLNSEQRLPLFVKKSDDEGISFYYLGDVVPLKDSFAQESMAIEGGKSVSVVKLLFRLKHSVPEALYNYLVA